jgi:Fe-S-cluster-containing dehydrogenase component
VVVKVRDGRPIKIEGNEQSKVFRGKTSARTQAAILNLYDDGARYKKPLKNGAESNWKEVDSDIRSALSKANTGSKMIAILTPSVYSPSLKRAIGLFKTAYPTAQHVQYDAISASGLLEAHKLAFGEALIPSFHFEKAEIILSFGADFLGTWLNPVEFARQYAEARDLITRGDSMAMHIQYESGYSLSGSNADKRVKIKPSQIKNLVIDLYSALKGQGDNADMKALASRLLDAKGKSLVVCGSNDTETQYMVAAINNILGNYGSTIDHSNPYYFRAALDSEFEALVDGMEKGLVDVLITIDANPVYTYHNSERLSSAFAKVGTIVSTATALDETAAMATYVCPGHDPLESWGDAEIKKGSFSLAQPCIHPIYDTRQALQSLLAWAGNASSAYDFVRETWQFQVFTAAGAIDAFNLLWQKTLQAGVFEGAANTAIARTFNSEQEAIILSKPTIILDIEFEYDLYESIQLGNGQHANNPWLQELPDPITKATWDNYAAVSPADALRKGWNDEDVIYFDNRVQLPVLIQPGQAEGVISIALGYGRSKAGKVGNQVGANAYRLCSFSGTRKYTSAVGSYLALNYRHSLARTQEHHTMEGRDIVRETTLSEYLQSPEAGNEKHAINESKHLTLYPPMEFPAHQWGLSINLNACTGCSACVIACQAENNVAVIGKEQVKLRRIMHWIRIDRYYSDDASNPDTVYQPLMCQHCDNAPCENVCPVAATMHSNEGLNQMAYNRCVGTKYCINNCPYKVRRFNWHRYVTNEAFDFNMNSDLARLALNPDVTVRERGVVEKCSFCVQRIQAGKLTAKLEGRELADGDIQTACMQSCPSNAIVFGDLKDKESKVAKLFENKRNYHLLEELHTLPTVGYLTKVRNREA